MLPSKDRELIAEEMYKNLGGIDLYESELDYYEKETEAAKNLYGKIAPLPDGADFSQMAAYTVLANVILNLDAILMKG